MGGGGGGASAAGERDEDSRGGQGRGGKVGVRTRLFNYGLWIPQLGDHHKRGHSEQWRSL